MKSIILGLLVISSLAIAQTGTPNCQFTYELTNRTTETTDGVSVIALTAGAGRTPSINNRQSLCNSWYMSVAVDGLSAVSMTLDDSQNVYTLGGGVPLAWNSWQGTILNGALPITATTSYQLSTTGFYPWVSVNVGSSTGTGNIYITLYGWKSPTMVAINTNVLNGIISPTNGGTGINNGSFTMAMSGNVTFTGAFNPTFAIPASATYTFPSASAALATLGSNTYTGSQILASGGSLVWTNRVQLSSTCSGCLAIADSAVTHYTLINGSAASLTSGFGTSPTVTGVAHMGTVNVGTGGTATSGVIGYAANAGVTNHYCYSWDITTPAKNTLMTCTNSGLAITISTSSAWNASDVLGWITAESN